eukprot:TRINITY_DN27333_c0_g1_i2.p1 TRINITY_DN27333_c0_g1~~TRINITY_DN27333_c0_g1_i2.p1  ORF type:complete len:1223 (+),score=404.59 TRINITY_DN27333_c0_g1_i2:93-3761(+)
MREAVLNVPDATLRTKPPIPPSASSSKVSSARRSPSPTRAPSRGASPALRPQRATPPALELSLIPTAGTDEPEPVPLAVPVPAAQRAPQSRGGAAEAAAGELPKLRRRARLRRKDWSEPAATPLDQLSLPKGTLPDRRAQRRRCGMQKLLDPGGLWPVADTKPPPPPRCATPPTRGSAPFYSYARSDVGHPAATVAAARGRPQTSGATGSPRRCPPARAGSAHHVPGVVTFDTQVTEPVWGRGDPPFAKDTASRALKRSPRTLLSPLIASLVEDIRGKVCEEDAAEDTAAETENDPGDSDGTPRGFDTLEGALSRLARNHKRLELHAGGGPSALDSLWSQAGKWLSRLDPAREVQGALRFAQAAFQADMEATRDYAPPCGPRLAGALRALDQLFAMLRRYLPAAGDMCAAVRKELLVAVYPVPPDQPPAELPSAEEAALQLKSPRRRVGDMYSGRKTYFQAVRMLTQRLTGQLSAGEQGQIKREREALAWQRILWHSEKRLLGRVFCAWRTMRRRERELEHLTRELDLSQARASALALDLQGLLTGKRKAEQELHQKIALLESQLAPMKGQLQAQLNQLSVLRQRIRDKDEEIDYQQKEKKQDADKARSEYEALCMVLWDWVARVRDDPYGSWEPMLRGRAYAKVLGAAAAAGADGQPSESGEQEAGAESEGGSAAGEKGPPAEAAVLEGWLRSVLEQSPFRDSMQQLIRLDEGQKSLDLFFAVLAQLSPGHADEELVQSAVEVVDPHDKALRLLELLHTMGIDTPLKAANLAGVSSEDADRINEAHQLLASFIFSRFCVTEPEERPVTWAAELDKEEFKRPSQQIISDAVLTAPEWRARLVDTTQRASEWRLAGQRVAAWALGRWLRTYASKEQQEEAAYRENLSALEEKDFDAFTTVDPDRYKEMVRENDEEEPDQAQVEQDVVEVQKFLKKNFRRMRRAYYHFTLQTSPPRVALDQFWRQLVDAKVTDKNFSRADVSRVFTLCNADEDHGLDAVEWIHAIFHLARCKYRQQTKTLAAKFQTFAQEYILRYHGGAVTDEFKRQVYDPRVQAVVNQYKKLLVKVFKYYAELDCNATDRRGDAAREVEFNEFMQLLQECKVMDQAPTCTQHAVSQVFAKVLGSDTLDVGTQQQGMLLHEFVEGLIGVACLKNASPFQPLHQKVQHFFETKVFEPLDKKLKLDYARQKRKEKDDIDAIANLMSSGTSGAPSLARRPSAMLSVA